jgi:multidrug efflux pump subunit AcrA (membrane-fusion protein)
MERIGRMLPWIVIALLPTLSGCENDSDQQLVNMAEQSLATQARQNEQLAEQSQRIADASRDLVAADAQARQELIEAQAKLQTALQADRALLDEQRDALELERQAVARARHRDPILAAALGSLGLLVACALPLFLAGYILYCANRPSIDHEILNELLITDLVAEQPRMLPISVVVPRIEHHAESTDQTATLPAP